MVKWFNPEKTRATAQALRQQAISPSQGQMVSGHYVGPTAFDALSKALLGYTSGRLEKKADEQQAAQSQALTQALLGQRGMAGPEQPLEQRLADVGTPQANQFAQQLAFSRAKAEMAPKAQMLTAQEAQALGLPSGNVYQRSATGEIQPVYEQKAPDLPSSVREYEYAKMQGYAGSFNDFVTQQKKAGAAKNTISIGGGKTVQVGDIPKGFQLEYDEQGRPFRMSPIAGSDPALERQMQAEKAQMRKEQEQSTANLMTQDISRAKSLVQNSPYLTAGFFGNLMKDWAGTPAADLKALSETIGANIGFDYLNQMRQSSPTGGALGNVTERELALLKATAGSIEQSQSPSQLMENLSRLERQFNEVVHGKQGVQTQETMAPQGVDPQVWQFMTPEERALFQ